MTEEEKMRLELLELKMDRITDLYQLGRISLSQKERDERINYLEDMIKILRKEY